MTFLDLAHLSLQEEAALATNWIDDRPEEPRVSHHDRPSVAQFTEKSDCRRPARNKQMRIFGPRETIDPSQESIGNCTGLLPVYGRLSTSFLSNAHFLYCMLLKGTLGGDFDSFAASDLKNRSRPIGVRVCLVSQIGFFITTFDPRAWTMVVFWKDVSGRQLPLLTPENEGGDESSSPSPPIFTFFDDLLVPIDQLVDLLLNHKIRRIRQRTLDFHQDCLQLLHLLVEREQERWINRVSDRARDHHHQILNLFTFQ